jgi:hypothetical protein
MLLNKRPIHNKTNHTSATSLQINPSYRPKPPLTAMYCNVHCKPVVKTPRK